MHAGIPQSNKRRRAGPADAQLLAPHAPRSGSAEAAESMRREQEEYQGSAAAREMMAFRRKLPSFHARAEFLSAVENHQVPLRHLDPVRASGVLTGAGSRCTICRAATQKFDLNIRNCSI